MDGAGAAGGVSVLLMSLASSTVRLAAPLVLTAPAGLYAERSGIGDIGLKSKMLAAAFVGAAVASLTGSAAVGESPEAVHAAGLSVARLRFCGNRGERGLMWGSRVSASRWHRATAFCAT